MTAKRKRTKPPRVVLLDTRQLAQLDGQLDGLTAVELALTADHQRLDSMVSLLHAEIAVLREMVRISSEAAQSLIGMLSARSGAAKRSNATRRAKVEAGPAAEPAADGKGILPETEGIPPSGPDPGTGEAGF